VSFEMHKIMMYFDQGSHKLHRMTKFAGVGLDINNDGITNCLILCPVRTYLWHLII
jgi:hypothetical protein